MSFSDSSCKSVIGLVTEGLQGLPQSGILDGQCLHVTNSDPVYQSVPECDRVHPSLPQSAQVCQESLGSDRVRVTALPGITGKCGMGVPESDDSARRDWKAWDESAE